EIPEETVAAIRAARAEGGRVIAVGTTVVRALEGCAALHGGEAVAGAGTSDLVIGAGFRPQVVDGLLTGMHEPEASHYRLLEAFEPLRVLERAHAHCAEGGDLAHAL